MKILVISNLYPPHYVGGYELACADVVEGLRKKGRKITVLSGWWGMGGPRAHAGALRCLKVRLFFEPAHASTTVGAVWDAWNCAVIRTVMYRLCPNLILAFNLSGLGAPFLASLHGLGIPIIHDISDVAMASVLGHWRASRRSIPFFHRAAQAAMLGALGARPGDMRLDLSKSYFRSDFLRRQFAAEGFDVSGLPVIHHGVRIPDRVFAMQDRPPSIMYAGRLSVEKGVHILLKALAHIADEFRGSGIVVTLAGATTATGDYARALRSLARECESAFRIQFLGRLSRKETQRRLAMHSVFAFPVLWDEPFSLSLLEAMANGLAIAACSTGGSSEVLCDGENALVVAREDPRAMGEALRRLLRDAGLRAKLASGALHTARSFELNRSVDRVDEYLGRWGPT